MVTDERLRDSREKEGGTEGAGTTNRARDFLTSDNRSAVFHRCLPPVRIAPTRCSREGGGEEERESVHQRRGNSHVGRFRWLPSDFRTVPTIGACKRSDLVVVPRPHYAESLLAIGKSTGAQIDHTRSYTSVSLTLRPPSSEPQPPIDIRSEGSSLTYSTSSLDPRGFQSRLQISIGPGNVGSIAAARIRPPMINLLPTQTSPQRPPGLPPGPPSQLPRPTTMSAPTTPSVPPTTNIVPTCSLPTTPSGLAKSNTPPSNSVGEQTASDQNRSPLSQVAEHQRKLVAEQLARKERLARELKAEKGRLEAIKKEVQALSRPKNLYSPEEQRKKLKSEIYMLQVECERLAVEVDQWSDRPVPLGETNEEFYQGIYTEQSSSTRPLNPQPPPLPNRPPAWRTDQPTTSDNNQEERDGPSWVCTMCTFDNHPLMNKCEECDMPRLLSSVYIYAAMLVLHIFAIMLVKVLITLICDNDRDRRGNTRYSHKSNASS